MIRGRGVLGAAAAVALLMVAALARTPAHAGFTATVAAPSAAAGTSLWFSCAAAVGDLAGSAVALYRLADADGVSTAQDSGSAGLVGTYWSGTSATASHTATTAHAAASTGPGGCAREQSTGFRATGSSFVGSPDLAGGMPTIRFTVAAWIRTGAGWTAGGDVSSLCNAQRTASCSQRDDRLYLSADGRLVFALVSASNDVLALTSTKVVADGAWHHVAGSLGTNGMRIWVDGADVTSTATASPNAATTAAVTTTRAPTAYWHIGAADSGSNWPNASATYFVGTIAHAALFKSALTARQIGSLAAAGR